MLLLVTSLLVAGDVDTYPRVIRINDTRQGLIALLNQPDANYAYEILMEFQDVYGEASADIPLIVVNGFYFRLRPDQVNSLKAHIDKLIAEEINDMKLIHGLEDKDWRKDFYKISHQEREGLTLSAFTQSKKAYATNRINYLHAIRHLYQQNPWLIVGGH